MSIIIGVQFVLAIKNNYIKLIILFFVTIYANKIIDFVNIDNITNYYS